LDDGDVVIDDVRFAANVVSINNQITVFIRDLRYVFSFIDPASEGIDNTVTDGDLTAPMPGKITAVFVKAGDKVERGAPLIVLEAMKMEHTITAPAKGQVTEVRYKAGDQVEDGEPLVVFEAS